MEKKSSVWVGAIIVSFISIIFDLILHLVHLDSNKKLGALGILIFILCVIIVCVQYSKSKDGNVTFGNLFAYGFRTTAAVVLIMIVWNVIKIKVIFPTYEDEALQKGIQAINQKGLSQEQLDDATAFSRKYFMTFIIGATILAYAIWGAIASLIGAAIAKKNPQAGNPFNQ